MGKIEKTIYTIGGSGFIGRHLITNLLKNDYFVTNIDPISFMPKCLKRANRNARKCKKIIHFQTDGRGVEFSDIFPRKFQK